MKGLIFSTPEITYSVDITTLGLLTAREVAIQLSMAVTVEVPTEER